MVHFANVDGCILGPDGTVGDTLASKLLIRSQPGKKRRRMPRVSGRGAQS